jgi:hypothetical protein
VASSPHDAAAAIRSRPFTHFAAGATRPNWQFLALWFVLGARHRCWPVWPGRMDRSGSDGARAIARFVFIARVTVHRSLISKGLCDQPACNMTPLATFARSLEAKDSHRAAWFQLHSQPDRPCRRTLDDRPVATPSPRRQLIHPPVTPAQQRYVQAKGGGMSDDWEPLWRWYE